MFDFSPRPFLILFFQQFGDFTLKGNFIDLAGGQQGEQRPDDEFLGNLIIGQPGLTVFPQLLFRDLLARQGHGKGPADLLVDVIGHTDDCGKQDATLGFKDFLYFTGINVFPPVLNISDLRPLMVI